MCGRMGGLVGLWGRRWFVEGGVGTADCGGSAVGRGCMTTLGFCAQWMSQHYSSTLFSHALYAGSSSACLSMCV